MNCIKIKKHIQKSDKSRIKIDFCRNIRDKNL